MLVQSAGDEVNIIEEFSEFSKSFLIASKFMTFSPELLKSWPWLDCKTSAYIFDFLNFVIQLSVINVVLMSITDFEVSFNDLSNLTFFFIRSKFLIYNDVVGVYIFWLLLHIWFSRRICQCCYQFIKGFFWWGLIFFFQIMPLLGTFFSNCFL